MGKYKIAIVNSSSFGQVFPEHWQQLTHFSSVDRFMVNPQITGADLAQKLHGYNIIIASVTPDFKADFFDHKDELYLISRHGIGYNNIDLKAAQRHGTQVTIVPPLVERNAVAENVLTNLMAIVRQTARAAQRVQADKYEERAQFMGREFTGKTFGVIGCGNIGSRVVELFHIFSDRILINDPQPQVSPQWWQQHAYVQSVTLNDLLEQADFISLNASLNDTDWHLINQTTLTQVKPGAYFVNHARGALIDEAAMLNALHKGIVAGYAADTMEKEPVRADHPFLKEPHCLITPHTSAYTYECLHGMGEKCVADVQNLVEHQPLTRELTHRLNAE